RVGRLPGVVSVSDLLLYARHVLADRCGLVLTTDHGTRKQQHRRQSSNLRDHTGPPSAATSRARASANSLTSLERPPRGAQELRVSRSTASARVRRRDRLDSAPVHGIAIIDKPAGLTSAAVVARVKRCTGAHKVGHTGTLDPMATGVLPLCLGEATKLA